MVPWMVGLVFALGIANGRSAGSIATQNPNRQLGQLGLFCCFAQIVSSGFVVLGISERMPTSLQLVLYAVERASPARTITYKSSYLDVHWDPVATHN